MSTVAPTVADDGLLWVRVTYTAATGVVRFYTADPTIATPVAADFTQLGTNVTKTATALLDSTALLEIGSNNGGGSNRLVGKVYRVQVRNGIDGTLVFDADLTSVAVLATSFTESSSNGATVTINSVAKVFPTGLTLAETDTPAAGTPAVIPAGTQAAETETASHGTAAVTTAGTQAAETETAFAGSLAVQLPGAQVAETDTAAAGTTPTVVPDEAGAGFARPRRPQRPPLITQSGTVWGRTVSTGSASGDVVRSGTVTGSAAVEASTSGSPIREGCTAGLTARGSALVGCCVRVGVTTATRLATSGLTRGAPTRCGITRSTTATTGPTPRGTSTRSGTGAGTTPAEPTTAWGAAVKVGALAAV